MARRPRPRYHGQPWKPEQDQVLRWFFGDEPVERTARRVGRTVAAVRARHRYLFGRASMLQGFETIAQLAERTGYTWHQIRDTMRRIDIRTGRTREGRQSRAPYPITEEQAARILEALAEESAASMYKRTVGDVARAVGAPRRTAYDAATRLGIPRGELDPLDADLLACDLAA